MAFNAGELVATIRLDGTAAFDRDVDKSGQKFTGLGDVAKKAGDIAANALKVAAASTVAGSVATAAYVASLFRTGVAYNTLQQTSRAALKTLVGGTEAANAQMDKLDAFARSSPFSKSVFISAQQQLLGFGYAAEKVIPTLDAIQQAVAATGGSSTDIAEITTVLAQISAAGKITATDLLQLGTRGINAAELIGSQMGKTGAQIKNDITAGTLDAGVALDALSAGMAAKFAGASANVKSTFAGTVDRIKAASREIGASLAEPFVSQQGGGLAVTWGNQVADIMRSVLKHTTPLVNLLTQRAMPAISGITTSLDKVNTTVKLFDPSKLTTTMNQLSNYIPVVAGFAGAWATVGLKSIPVLDRLFKGLQPLPVALAAIALSSPDIRRAGAELLGAFQPLIPVATSVAEIFANSLNQALPVVAGLITGVARAAVPLVDAVAQIPAPLLVAVAGFIGVQRALKPLEGAISAAGKAFQILGERMAVQAALGAMEGSTNSLRGAFGLAGMAATTMGNSMKAAFISNPVGLALLGISLAAAALITVFSQAAERTANVESNAAALRDTLNETTGAITKSTEAMVRKNLEEAKAYELADKIGISYDVVTAAAMGNADAMAAVEAATKKYDEANKGNIRTSTGSTHAMNIESSTSHDLKSALNQQRDAVELAQTAQARLRTEMAQAAASMTDAERSNRRMKDALALARDTTAELTDRIKGLNAALDELNGGTLTQEEAAAKLNATNLSLAEGLAQTDENGARLWSSMVDGAGKIDTTTRAGLGLFGSLKSAKDAMSEAMITASDYATANGNAAGAIAAATAAGDAYIATLRQTLIDGGVAVDTVDALIASYVGVPSQVSTVITDLGTGQGVINTAKAVADAVLATPDKEIKITEPYSPSVIKQLENLGFEVNNIPGGVVRVREEGIDGVRSKLNDLKNTDWSTVFRVNVEPSYGQGLGVLKPTGSENGNFFSGGTPQAFENGGLVGSVPTGIYKGRRGSIHRFAEENVPWEAYVSGKAGQEARNRRILASAAERLGMAVVPRTAGVQAFENGGMLGRSYDGGYASSSPIAGGDLSIRVSIGPIVANPDMDLNELVDKVADKVTTQIERRIRR